MNRRRFVKGFGTTALVGGMAGCSGSGDVDDEQSSPTVTPPKYPNATHSNEPQAERPEIIELEAEQQEEGGEIYAVGKVENLTGRPIRHATVIYTLVDELGDNVDSLGISVHGLIHGDVWEFRKRWDGTNNQIRAVGGLEARVQVNGYLDPKAISNQSDNCADLDDWMCTDTLRVDSVTEEFVTVTEGGERWTVYGDITNISDSEADTHAIAANYIQNGTIVESSFNGFVSLGPGETDDYRIEFGQTRPSGELRLTLLDEI